MEEAPDREPGAEAEERAREGGGEIWAGLSGQRGRGGRRDACMHGRLQRASSQTSTGRDWATRREGSCFWPSAGRGRRGGSGEEGVMSSQEPLPVRRPCPGWLACP